MTHIHSPETIIHLLHRLDDVPADRLESEVLDFKRWEGAKKSLSKAIQIAVCFANTEGGLVVFGVKDNVKGRTKAISGCERYDLDVWRRGIYESTRPHLTVEISELEVPEGNLILVRVPKGPVPPYGTAAGLYQIRVGKNCMPYSPEDFQRRQISTGALDWSGEVAEGVGEDDLDPTEIARLRNLLRAHRHGSSLLDLDDRGLLAAIGVVKDTRVTLAGFLVVGRSDSLAKILPGHEIIYLHYSSPTDLDFRLDLKAPLLQILERLTEAINARNPFRTLKTGLFHTDIPAFPEEAFREAILNAVIHRNYLEPGSVYVKHSEKEMVITSPGGFIGGITPENVLRAEPKARNRLLAEIFQKIGLVERAGIGRRRIFIPTLAYGKRPPLYEANEHNVRLTLYDGSFDEGLASFIGKRQRAGETFDLDELLLLSHLREHPEIEVSTASRLCQLPKVKVRDRLDQLCLHSNPWLERRGKKKGVTYHLSRSAAAEFVGKGVYTLARTIDRVQWPALIQKYVEEKGSINNSECRELLLLGNSRSARTTVSRLLAGLDFLEPYGRLKTTRYRLKEGK
ncbi:MAG: putative DNA binding domain-containing protein [Thermodesulfobacteriota bacterium]|nr:putative DNA binding domain-containing protein [Thermodesulfobacteriota bacterium]